MTEYTLGIDLASQPRNTAVCRLGWDATGCRVDLLEQSDAVTDQRLLSLMLDAPVPARIGIDAPLGWPAAFTAGLSELDDWPLTDPARVSALTKRQADLWVQRTFQKVPLSVSADRIAYPALRAVGLLSIYQQRAGIRVDRSGMSGPVAEVYPDTAVSAFGLRPPGRRVSYKAADGRTAREGLLERLIDLAPWLVIEASDRQRCVQSDDCFDALIAALITRSVQLGLTYGPPEPVADAARSEGWIHVPRVDVPLSNALVRLDPRA